MKTKIRFLDCGGNIGQTIDWALANLEEYDIKIDCFEANPGLIGIIEQKVKFIDEDITIHSVGVDTENSAKNFYLQSWGARTGSSLIKGKESTDDNDFVEIQTINLCDWITENCNFEEEFVIVKLDVEGSEYKIVESMIDSQLYKNIGALLVEWTPDVKFIRNKEMTESSDHRRDIVESASSKFDIVLDWHSPDECIDPLKEIVSNNVKKT